MGEAQTAGSLMATKLITKIRRNLRIHVAEGLSAKTQAMLSVFLISFANFGSIGIIAGSVKGLHSESGDKVARFGLKLVYGATLYLYLVLLSLVSSIKNKTKSRWISTGIFNLKQHLRPS